MEQPTIQDIGQRGQLSPNALASAGLALGLMLVAVVFFREGKAAVEVWIASTAYSHCFLILPMVLYLLWDRRSMLAHFTARSEPAWACLALPVTLVWFAAERLGIMEGRQLAVIAGVQVLFLTVLGWAFYRRCSGPLLVLFFLVPFGAFLTPTLQRFTAAFTIGGLDLLSIPNYSDGNVIETQAGTFFVAEACAGLRFLVASVAFGVFYALLTYTSIKRRLAFILLSIAVPIVANGFRALGIVVLGQILGSAQAAAADHIVYGWIFFSAVMLMLIVLGQTFREPSVVLRPSIADRKSKSSGIGAISAAFIVVALLGLGPAAASAIDTRSASFVLTLGPLLRTPDGCTNSPEQPGSQLSLIECDGTVFTVTAVAFSPRSTSTAMVAARRRATQEIGAEDVSVATVEAPKDGGHWTIVQTSDPNRVTAYASWVDGLPVRTGLAGRLAQARDSLFGSDYAPILITVSTPESEHSTPAQRALVMNLLKSLIQAQPKLNQLIATSARL